MSYYDIDSILTDAQKIPCTFNIPVPGLGYLDGSTTADIKPHIPLQLPLWLAEFLAVSQPSTRTPLVSLDLPTCLSPRVLNALKADPTSVDLRSLATHFYALGVRCLQLFEDEELSGVLAESFKMRAGVVKDLAANLRGGAVAGGAGVGGEGGEFLRTLDEWERQVFRAAHDSAKQMKAFMNERGGKRS